MHLKHFVLFLLLLFFHSFFCPELTDSNFQMTLCMQMGFTFQFSKKKKDTWIQVI